MAGGRVVLVRADVAAPDDPGAMLHERLDKARGLGVVKDDDVARAHEPRQAAGVASGHAFVGRPIPCIRQAAFRHAVHQLVEALGEAEERRIAVEDHPARVDTDPGGVAEERPQDLSDASAVCRGAHVPVIRVVSYYGTEKPQS